MTTENKKIQLQEFITLGQRLYVLMHPYNPETVVGEIPKFIQSLEKCELKTTLNAAKPLNEIYEIRYILNKRTGNMISQDMEKIRGYMQPIYETLYKEAGEKLVREINKGAISQEIQSLLTKMSLNEKQQILLTEMKVCLECGAYRAAIIMGWNFTYDFICQWIFDHKLIEFNNILTTEYKKRNDQPIYESINRYDDFWQGKIGERIVIDTCEKANLINGKLYDNLCHHLRRRNETAHPNPKQPNLEQANAYIKDLIDIITSQPFV